MRTIAIFLLSTAIVAAGCKRSSRLERDQQQYEVVQEGSASGVSSTISAPGETTPPLMPTLTGTNADTTTAFTLPNLPPGTTTSTAPPGTIAGTLPVDPYGRDPRAPRTAPRTPPPAQRDPQPEPQPQPPTTTTAEPAPPTPPPSTDTTATEKPPEKKEEAPPPPPPPADNRQPTTDN